MDLKNLISRTSDDEFPSNTSSKQKLERESSQPRLSIHSLMNDNDNNETNLNNKLDDNNNSNNSTIDRDSLIPKPTVSTSSNESIPTIDQKIAPFIPSNEHGAIIDSVKKTEEEKLESEPKFQVNNTTESKSDDSARIRRKSSISALTNHTDPTIITEKPPLPNLKSSENGNQIIDPNKNHETQLNKLNEISEQENNNKKNNNDITIGKSDKESLKEIKDIKKKSDNKIHNQIQKLEELKNKEEIEESMEGKPKRYKTKPIWAQDYIPTFNQNLQVGDNIKQDLKINGSSFNNISKLTIPSITGSIPRNDFNKLVTEWIWANVEGVKKDNFDIPNVTDYIEIESKLGNIWDKVKDRRIQLPVNTECVVATDYVNQECFFKPGITLENYNDTKAFVGKLIKEASEQNSSNNKSENKFIIENSHVVDLIASDSRRNDKPISGRVSLDIKTKRKTNSITKQRISDLYLHFPNCLFDLRLSLSVEFPKELNDAAFEVFKKRVTLEREKERISYIHQATATRIDLTKVREKTNRVPKYELELELNTPALIESMNNIMEDPLYYIDLVQAFLDNNRIIARHLSMQRQ